MKDSTGYVKVIKCYMMWYMYKALITNYPLPIVLRTPYLLWIGLQMGYLGV